ncbi:alpha/beta fold hydrolase [Indioceanicola profundi]|uniref:alpha/beta fold hydrolase n=1 Tax=Indioceanicola profundi TaxID=2220096 RepID=UPI001CECDA21|nr:alpha/beta hydrolase [Indioceanicola profundi]
MKMPTNVREIATSHGKIAVEDNERDAPILVLIHGNSSCRRVFDRQAGRALGRTYRLITFDLPGHGDSGDADRPECTYTLPGLADATAELLAKLGISEAVVLGWSLGGHIAIEMLGRFGGIKGLVLTGTPPVKHGGLADGFVRPPNAGLAARQDMSAADIDMFAHLIFGEPVAPFIREAIRRADGRCRRQLFEAALAGAGVDQRAAVEASSVPIAVINGSADPLIKLDYIDSIEYGNLWERKCHRINGAGHAPFWHAADAFNAIVARFLDDLQAPRHDQSNLPYCPFPLTPYF